MPDKIVRNIDQKTWNTLKKLAIDFDVSLAEMIKIIIDYYKEQNDGQNNN
jgi:hypothetical protein